MERPRIAYTSDCDDDESLHRVPKKMAHLATDVFPFGRLSAGRGLELTWSMLILDSGRLFY